MSKLGADCFLVPAVLIVETDDIILAQIAADLNFDQLKWYLARIGEPMDVPDRDVDRLVFVYDANVGSRP